MQNIKRILVTKFKHIGDVLLMTPVLRALKNHFPDSQIMVVVNKGTQEMLWENKYIDELIVYDRQIKQAGLLAKIKGEWQLLRQIKAFKPDLSVELSGGDRGALLSYFSGALIRLGYAKGKKGLLGRNLLFTHVSDSNNTTKHMIEHNLAILQEIGIAQGDKALDLWLSAQEEKKAVLLLADYQLKSDDLIVTIHPTSRWFFKCWKDEYIAEISDYLVEKFGAKIIITAGGADKELNKVQSIIDKLKYKHIVNLAGKISLRDLAAVLKISRLFIGIDSSPMHMASALKTPSIVLFGPSGDKNWGPLNKEAVTICKHELKCMPCGKAGCNDLKKSDCLEMITPEEVKREIDKILSV